MFFFSLPIYNLTNTSPLSAAASTEDQDWQVDLSCHIRFSCYYLHNSRSSLATASLPHLLLRRKYT